MKIAIIGVPQIGGGYTNFKFLKDYSKFTIELITIGNYEKANLFFDEKEHTHLGSDLKRRNNERELAQLLKNYLEANSFDILIPMNSPIAISIIPYLDSSKIKIIQRVNSDTHRVYKYITSHLNSCSQIVCNSKKQYLEIKKRVDPFFFKSNVHLIPHGVELSNKQINFESEINLRIGYLGRMHQTHKNIFIIPEILSKLDFDFDFELIGGGEDKIELLEKFKEKKIPFSDIGVVPNENLNDYLENWDILLFPSVLEGFGYTLLEAMNNSVVPVANRIKNITDFIISDKFNGFIIDNNVGDYVKRIEFLNANRGLLKEMKMNAVKTVEERFNVVEIVKEYDNVFRKSLKCESSTISVLDFSKWEPYVEYKPGYLKRVLNLFKKI